MPEYLTIETPLWPTKDATVKNDFGVDWSDMAPETDSVTSADWTGPAEITITNKRNEGLQSFADIEGGTPGAIHDIEITALTAQGRRLNRTMQLIVIEKKE